MKHEYPTLDRGFRLRLRDTQIAGTSIQGARSSEPIKKPHKLPPKLLTTYKTGKGVRFHDKKASKGSRGYTKVWGKLRAQAPLPPEKNLGAHRIGSWEDPTAEQILTFWRREDCTVCAKIRNPDRPGRSSVIFTALFIM